MSHRADGLRFSDRVAPISGHYARGASAAELGLLSADAPEPAMGVHFNSPLFALSGCKCAEIEPWHKTGEVWRRLRVVFPDYIATHTKEQISHFGPDGLLRRHKYTVDIMGRATGTNYVSRKAPTDLVSFGPMPDRSASSSPASACGSGA